MFKVLFQFLRPYYCLPYHWIDSSLVWWIFCTGRPPPHCTPHTHTHTPPPPTHTHTHIHSTHPRSYQNQGHGHRLRIFQKQNVQYQASYPVWRHVLFSQWSSLKNWTPSIRSGRGVSVIMKHTFKKGKRKVQGVLISQIQAYNPAKLVFIIRKSVVSTH